MTPVGFVAWYLMKHPSASNAVIAQAGRSAGLNVHGAAFYFGRKAAGRNPRGPAPVEVAAPEATVRRQKRHRKNGHDPIAAIRAALLDGERAKKTIDRIREMCDA